MFSKDSQATKINLKNAGLNAACRSEELQRLLNSDTEKADLDLRWRAEKATLDVQIRERNRKSSSLPSEDRDRLIRAGFQCAERRETVGRYSRVMAPGATSSQNYSSSYARTVSCGVRDCEELESELNRIETELLGPLPTVPDAMRVDKLIYDYRRFREIKPLPAEEEKSPIPGYPTLDECIEHARNGMSDGNRPYTLTESDEHIIGDVWAFIESRLSR